MHQAKRLFMLLVVLVSSGCTPLHPSRPTASILHDRTALEHSETDITNFDRETASSPGSEVVMHALTLLKSKYRFGGKNPETGLDCSGLVSHVYDNALGLTIEGSASNMASQGRRVTRQDLKEGDLVFFNTRGRPRSHVGIYVGNDKFVHAENSRTGIRINRLSDRYYAARFEEARTLLH
ncbi:C40 family peptidase [Achromobacter xylosoxidans]